MVLEISATPYIFTFKMWDWGRLGLDGTPRPIHLEHGLRNIQWDRTTAWVREEPGQSHHRGCARATAGWRNAPACTSANSSRRGATGSPAPVLHSTNGGVNVLNLCEGREAMVESPNGKFPPFVVHYAETFIIPACVGEYSIRPHGEADGKSVRHHQGIRPHQTLESERHRMKSSRIRIALFVLICACSALQAAAQTLSPTEKESALLASKYAVFPDVTYGTASNYRMKLDVWQRANQKTPVPTVIYFHGGGWIFGDRTGATLWFLPYLELGWNVLNVEYRMADVARAPAAVEDTRCALRWAMRNAKQYNIDVNKIVLTGHSAGGHLSLITGMLPDGTGLDNNCYPDEKWGTRLRSQPS